MSADHPPEPIAEPVWEHRLGWDAATLAVARGRAALTGVPAPLSLLTWFQTAGHTHVDEVLDHVRTHHPDIPVDDGRTPHAHGETPQSLTEE